MSTAQIPTEVLSKFILHSRQMEAILMTREYPAVKYVAGIRNGKSVTGSHFILENIYERPDELGGICAPTHRVLTQMTLKEFKKVLDANGIYQDIHYIVNKNPTPIFGYQSKFPDSHDGVWSFCNGYQIFTFSLESFFRGAEFGHLWGDEMQDQTKEIIDTILGRMSGSKKGSRILFTYTPPANNPDVDAMTWGETAWPGVFGTTYDNAKNLPDGYIEMLKRTMAPVTFEREVLCLRRTTSGLNWLYTFDKNKHVSDRAKMVQNQIVNISFDFNNNPFVCTLAHRGPLPGKQFGYIHIFAEIEIDPDAVGGRTYFEAIAEEIKRTIPYQFQNKLFLITGDASGKNQSILSRVGENIWTELMRALNVNERHLILDAKNPELKDSRELCNAIFANYDEVLINPGCKSLIRDCEFVKAKPDGSILKDNRNVTTQQADLMDALRYYLHYFHGDFIKRT